MSAPGSVGGGERVRLFCALRLPHSVVDVLVAWQLEHVVRGRAVPRDNLHVTLAFIGWTPRERLDEVVRQLADASAAAQQMRLEPVGYRETRSVGMVVLRDERGAAAAFAADLHGRLERLGVYEREARTWLPHVTVSRFKERTRLHPPPPATGPIVPSEAAAYLSLLRPSGAEYVVLESVTLGGN